MLGETESANPAKRTKRNAREADGVLVLVEGAGPLTQGTELTLCLAQQFGKPFLVVNMGKEMAVRNVAAWFSGFRADFSLLVAGPRESKAPGVFERAKDFLSAVIDTIA